MSLNQSMKLVISLLLLYPAGSLLGAETTAEKVNPFSQLLSDQKGIGNCTGVLHYRLPLYTLETRGGLSLDLALNYSSNIAPTLKAGNDLAPTGWLGLGWNMTFGSIECIHQGTKTHGDDHFFWTSMDGARVRMWKGENDQWHIPENPYMTCKPIDNNNDGVYDGWTIKRRDGTVLKYGDLDFTAEDDMNATRYLLNYDEYVGELEGLTSKPANYPYQWDLVEITDQTGKNWFRFRYSQDKLTSSDGYEYTRASYPDEIVDPTGQKVSFIRKDKLTEEHVRTRQSGYSPYLLSGDFRWEDEFLSRIVITTDLKQTRSFSFSYDFAKTYNPTELYMYSEFHKKRRLSSIEIEAEDEKLNYGLIHNHSPDEDIHNPQALREVHKPHGAGERFVYGELDIPSADIRSHDALRTFTDEMTHYGSSVTSDGKPYVVYGDDTEGNITIFDGINWTSHKLYGSTDALFGSQSLTDIDLRGDRITVYNKPSSTIISAEWNGANWKVDGASKTLGSEESVGFWGGSGFVVVKFNGKPNSFSAFIRKDRAWVEALTEVKLNTANPEQNVTIWPSDDFFVVSHPSDFSGNGTCSVYRFKGPKHGNSKDWDVKSITANTYGKGIHSVFCGKSFFVVTENPIAEPEKYMHHYIHIVGWDGKAWEMTNSFVFDDMNSKHPAITDIVCGDDYFLALWKGIVTVYDRDGSKSWTNSTRYVPHDAEPVIVDGQPINFSKTEQDLKPFWDGLPENNCDTLNPIFAAAGKNFFVLAQKWGGSDRADCAGYNGTDIRVFHRTAGSGAFWVEHLLYESKKMPVYGDNRYIENRSSIAVGDNSVVVDLRGEGELAERKLIQTFTYDGKAWNDDYQWTISNEKFRSETARLTAAGPLLAMTHSTASKVEVLLKYQDSFDKSEAIETTPLATYEVSSLPTQGPDLHVTFDYDTTKKDGKVVVETKNTGYNYLSGLPMHNKVARVLKGNGRLTSWYFNGKNADNQKQREDYHVALRGKPYKTRTDNETNSKVAGTENNYEAYHRSPWPGGIYDLRLTDLIEDNEGVSHDFARMHYNDAGLPSFRVRGPDDVDNFRLYTKYAHEEYAALGPEQQHNLIQEAMTLELEDLTVTEDPLQPSAGWLETPISSSYIRGARATTYTKSNNPNGLWYPSKTYRWKAVMDDGEPVEAMEPFNFVDPASNITNGWEWSTEYSEYDQYGQLLEKADRLVSDAKTYSINVYDHRGLLVSTIKNARRGEAGVLSCDYDLGDEATYTPSNKSSNAIDGENGWVRNGNSADVRLVSGEALLGEKCLLIENGGGTRCNYKMKEGVDYILSAWLKVKSGELKMDGHYSKLDNTDTDGFPYLLPDRPNDGGSSNTFKDFGCDPITISGKNDAKWQYKELHIPCKSDIEGEWFAQVALTVANGGAAYLQDIRFYPADAHVTTTFYGENRLARMNTGADGQPSVRKAYDGLERPIKWEEAHFNGDGTFKEWMVVQEREYHLSGAGTQFWENHFEANDPKFYARTELECPSCASQNGVAGGKKGKCASLYITGESNTHNANRMALDIPNSEKLKGNRVVVTGFYKLPADKVLRTSLFIQKGGDDHWQTGIDVHTGIGDWQPFRYEGDLTSETDFESASFMVQSYQEEPVTIYIDEIEVSVLDW